MARVDPRSGRVRTDVTGGGYHIVIKAKSNRFGVPFLALWLCAWVAGLVAVSNNLLTAPSGEGTLFNWIWLAGWIAGGIGVMAVLLWMIVGREEIRIGSTGLQYVRSFGPFTITREYDMAHVKRMRVSPPAQTFTSGGWQPKFILPWMNDNGFIAFDYGASTPRFALELGEPEARSIVEMLVKRFPNLRDTQ